VSNDRELAQLRRSILSMAFLGKEGHIPSSLSILELVWAAHGDGFVTKGNESRFVLSKGHGCLALYAVLVGKGYFPDDWLSNFAQPDSPLGGHPDSTLVPGVEASTGSLGHGFPMAVGMAYAEKMKCSSATIYVLIGDGEANEGSVWEAALLAAHHKLDNLVCIIDDNGSSTRAIDMGGIGKKFEGFDWTVSEINGHDVFEIRSSLKMKAPGPHAIIARTVKGHGIREMESNPAWHHTALSKEDHDRFLDELR